MTSAGDASYPMMEMRRIFCRSDRLDTEQKSKNFLPGCLPVSTCLYSRVFKLDSRSAP